MHVDNLDDLSRSLIDLALATVLVLRLVLLCGGLLRSLVAIRSHHRLERLVSLVGIRDKLLLLWLALALFLHLLLLSINERPALAPNDIIIA